MIVGVNPLVEKKKLLPFLYLSFCLATGQKCQVFSEKSGSDFERFFHPLKLPFFIIKPRVIADE